jgi:2'-5' RNA ligase
VFPQKDFGWDGSGKFKNKMRKWTTDHKKTRRKEWRKEKQEIYRPHATLPQDDGPLVWEPPLQQKKLVDTCFYLTI